MIVFTNIINNMSEKQSHPLNQHPADGKLWRAAIRKALEKRSKSRTDGFFALVEIAEKFLDACEEKQGWAIKELGERIDGKVSQEISGTLTITHEQAIAALFDQPDAGDSAETTTH